MIPVRFHDLDTKQRALDLLAGRYSVKNCPTAELHVPAAALAELAAEGLDFQVMGSAAPGQDRRVPIMPGDRLPPVPSSSCLVRIDSRPDGQFTAQLLGAPDISATAATPEDAVDQVRVLLQQQVNLDSIMAIEIPQQHPLAQWAGAWKDDPDFDLYLEEIRKFREEMDRREGYVPDADECSDTSSTPTT